MEHNNIPLDLISKVPIIDSSEPVTKMIPKLGKVPAAVVTKGGKYYGILDMRSIYRYKGALSIGKGQKVESFVKRVKAIDESVTIDALAERFLLTKAKALPYIQDGQIIGVVDRNTMLKMMLSLHMLEGAKVSEAMTTPVIAIDGNASIAQARKVMLENNINRLVVITNGKFDGLITNFDLVHKYSNISSRLPEMHDKAYYPSNVQIKAIAEKNPRVAQHTDTLSEAARELVENNISSLVVLNGQRPVGILTIHDLLHNIVARRRIEESKFVISGIDQKTAEYEDEMRSELKALVSKLGESRAMEMEYLHLNIKSIKGKRYEMELKISMGKNGTVNVSASDFIFEKTFSELMKRAKEKFIRLKEKKIDLHRAETQAEEE
ncbi:MAG: CBS domain-containing protein [Candidatus Micrarchaeaceae archaeon]